MNLARPCRWPVVFVCYPGAFIAGTFGGRLTVTVLWWRWWVHPGPRVVWTHLPRSGAWALRLGCVVVSWWGG